MGVASASNQRGWISHHETAQHPHSGGLVRLPARYQAPSRRPHVKLVCLPAEADAINTDGIRVRMPVKGHEGLVEVHSWKLPGQAVREGRGRSSPRSTTSSRSRCRSRSTAPPACASCSTPSQGEGAVHVDHEHAAAAVPRAHTGAFPPRSSGPASPTRASGTASSRR